jgi:hypothetical protein
MENALFWSIVKKYNELMKEAIVGPNCIDLNVCRGDCCSIKIDIPKVLAKEYIKRGLAEKEDFIRSDIFSFYLRFDLKTRKCFLFDKKINGCSVHNSGIKPPQCWIYPTNFSNPDNKEISCKRAKGWKIIDLVKTEQAETLLQQFTFLSQIEAMKEKRNILKRVRNKLTDLRGLLKKTSPSQFGGFKDTWDCFKILPAEGLSLQMKKFCSKYNKNCEVYSDNFLDCSEICDIIIQNLTKFLQKNINEYVKELGIDTEGDFPLYKLFEFMK